jgi:hypothetical protein
MPSSFENLTKMKYPGNPHPNGVYSNSAGFIIVDNDLSKYITIFYVMDDGSIWMYNEDENFKVYGT